MKLKILLNGYYHDTRPHLQFLLKLGMGDTIPLLFVNYQWNR